MKEIKLFNIYKCFADLHKDKISLVDIIGQSDQNIFILLEFLHKLFK
jgi:hypothetical protein